MRRNIQEGRDSKRKKGREEKEKVFSLTLRHKPGDKEMKEMHKPTRSGVSVITRKPQKEGKAHSKEMHYFLMRV